MAQGPTDDEDSGSGGTVLSFPNGEQVSASEVGADFVVGQGGSVPTAELVDPASLEKELRDRDSFVRNEGLTRVIEGRAAPSDVLDELLKEIAEELGHLKFERRKAAKEGKNTANYTISRIASLRQLADVVQKRQENARQERFDLKSPRFKQILHMWMGFWYDSMIQAGLDEGTVDSVFKIVEANMVDWEKRVIDTVE